MSFTFRLTAYLSQADDIRALLIDAMPPDALPSCLKPQATVVSEHVSAHTNSSGEWTNEKLICI